MKANDKVPYAVAVIACSWAALASAADAPGATAEETSASGIEEVLVTAQKRTERLSEVPLAVSALSGESLLTRGYDSLESFTGAVPGLSINNFIGEARINIRGIGQTSFSPGAEGSTAYHKNGVYLARPSEGSAGFLDVDRIEVVRGPQGTLYGRNATGGSVNVITKRPTDRPEVNARVELGDYDRIAPELIVSGRVAGDVLGRLAVSSEDRDGYSKNLANGKRYDDAKARTARGTLVFGQGKSLQATLIGEYHEEHDDNYATHYLGQGNPAVPLVGAGAGGVTVPLDSQGLPINPRQLSNDAAPENDRESWGVTLDTGWALRDGLNARSITAYYDTQYRAVSDLDGTTAIFPTDEPGRSGIIQSESARQFSEELQLLGSINRLDWIVGAYYFNERNNPAFIDIGLAPAPGSPLLISAKAKTEAYAVFGQADVGLSDTITVTLGGRWSDEKRSIVEDWTSGGLLLGGFGPCVDLPGGNCLQDGTAKFHAFTPKLGVEFRPKEGFLTYISASRGFKSGGYSLGDLKPAFNPEKVWAYEVGLKTRTAGNRAQLNVSAFHYDYNELQIQKVINGFLATENAAKSDIDGAEIEGLLKLTDSLDIALSLSWLDTKFAELMTDDPAFPALGVQDLSGNRLPQAPKYSSNIAVTYTVPLQQIGDLRFFAEWNRRGKVYFTEFNLANAEQSAVSTLNAAVRLTSQSERWYVEAFGHNLTDELIISQNFVSSGAFGRPRNGQLLPPRVWGIGVGYKFL